MIFIVREVVQIKLNTVSINEKEQIFLDGIEIKNIKEYRLEHSASLKEPAKLAITLYVNVGQETCPLIDMGRK